MTRVLHVELESWQRVELEGLAEREGLDAERLVYKTFRTAAAGWQPALNELDVRGRCKQTLPSAPVLVNGQLRVQPPTYHFHERTDIQGAIRPFRAEPFADGISIRLPDKVAETLAYGFALNEACGKVVNEHLVPGQQQAQIFGTIEGWAKECVMLRLLEDRRARQSTSAALDEEDLYPGLSEELREDELAADPPSPRSERRHESPEQAVERQRAERVARLKALEDGTPPSVGS